METQRVTLNPGESQEVVFKFTPTKVGVYDIAVDGLYGVLTVELEQGVYQGLVVGPDGETIAGANISVDGLFHTTSGWDGGYRTGLLYFGMHIITVFASNYKTAEFAIDLVEGTQQVNLELEPLPEPPPGPVAVDEIVIDPPVVELGNRVSIRVCLMGPYPDVYPRPYTIVVTVDGETLTKDVEMNYRNPCFPLPYTPTQVGIYTAVSGGKSAHFECVAPPPPPPTLLPDDAIRALPLYCDWYGRKGDRCGDKVVDYYSVPALFELMGVTAYCKQSTPWVEISGEADIAESEGPCGQSKTIEGCKLNCGRVSQTIPSIVGGRAVVTLKGQPTDGWTAYIHTPTIKEPYSFRKLAEISGFGNIIRFENIPYPPDHYKRTLFLTISFTNGEVWCRPGALCFSSAVTPEHRLGWEEYYVNVEKAQLDCARAELINYVRNPYTVSSAMGHCLVAKAVRLGLDRNYQFLTVWEIENGYQNKLAALNEEWDEFESRFLQLRQELNNNWEYGGPPPYEPPPG